MAAPCSPSPTGPPRRTVAPSAPSPSSPTTPRLRGISPATSDPTQPPRPTAPAPSVSRVRPRSHPFCPSCFLPAVPPVPGDGGRQGAGVRFPFPGRHRCRRRGVQEGVCGRPCRTPGTGSPLSPPQLLSHPAGNEEAAEPCPSSMAGESPGCATAGMSVAGEGTRLGSWQGSGWGRAVVRGGPQGGVGLGKRG